MNTLKTSQKKTNFSGKIGRQSVISKTRHSSLQQATLKKKRRIDMTHEYFENVTFIWFGTQEYLATSLIGSLRAINQQLEIFTDLSACINAVQSSREKVFFITSSNSSEFITKVHEFTVVEAIFIFHGDDNNMKGDFPKLFGIFNQQEELLRAVKDALQVFEQIQLEEFTFGGEPSFLWLQLWKEDLMSRKQPANKDAFINTTRSFYRDNPRVVENIDKLGKSYRPTDAINWCCRSPFPGRFLLHSLFCRNKTKLNLCRFLFADAARTFRQTPKRKSSEQVYRGMKISRELLDKFEANVGQVMCTSSFFPCIKSRTNALTYASLPTYRPDLLPVLFKIDCDPSSLFMVLPNRSTSPVIVFDACTPFRVEYVNRDSMSIIKLKTVGEVGKKIVSEFLQKHPNETITSILDELLKPPKPPTPPAPTEPTTPAPPLAAPMTPPKIKSASLQRPEPAYVTANREPDISAQEIKAQQYVEEGNIDLALIAYRRIQPVTTRILNMMGQLSADRKGDYDFALQCHQEALKLQDTSSEDITDTLTCLGNLYHKRGEYDLAFEHHQRALKLRTSNSEEDSFGMACNLIGIADVHWALHQYAEAISNAEKALQLQETRVPQNERSLGATLALLTAIYQSTGDTSRAIELCKKAIVLFERTGPQNLPILAELLYKLGSMQSNAGALNDALISLEKSVNIYEEILPREHPDRIAAHNELERIVALCQIKRQKSRTSS